MRLKSSALIFSLMFIQFLIITWNTMGIASHNKALVFITDLTLTTLNFTLLKKVIDADSRIEMIAYALGGALGAQLAMVLIK